MRHLLAFTVVVAALVASIPNEAHADFQVIRAVTGSGFVKSDVGEFWGAPEHAHTPNVSVTKINSIGSSAVSTTTMYYHLQIPEGKVIQQIAVVGDDNETINSSAFHANFQFFKAHALSENGVQVANWSSTNANSFWSTSVNETVNDINTYWVVAQIPANRDIRFWNIIVTYF